MSFLTQLPRLMDELEAATTASSRRSYAGRRRLAAVVAGLVSLLLAAGSLAVAFGLDARLALVFAPALLLTLVLVYDLGRPGQEAGRAV